MLRNSTLRHGENTPIDVQVTDLSATGFSVDAPMDLAVGAIVRLGLGGAGTAPAQIVRRTNSTYGAEFLEPLSPEKVAAAFRYSEILATIGGNTDGDSTDDVKHFDDDRVENTDRWSRRTRIVVMLSSAGAAWAALVLVWLAV
ncbi:PilZ domain-containing protein [Sphingomonas sp. M1A8_2b]